jgi:tRNA(Ile)-lysidine synthase
MSLDDFAEHFLATFPDLVGQRVLVALSGGADSVALLQLLTAEDLALEIEAAHVHHGVRGPEADRDASFCEGFCEQREIPFHLLRIEPHPPLPSGREGTWRRRRYRALLELAERGGFAAIATGHHRDDVAEGVLVQLLRGGGPRALSGIEASTPSGIIRPLLPWSRRDLRAWLEERGVSWQEDSSNLDIEHLRNRVRLDLLPGLESVSPSVRQHLVHLAQTLAADEAYLADQLTARARWIDPWDPDGGVPEAAVQSLAVPLRTRWLHAQTARIGLERVTRRQVELFGAMIEEGQPRAITLGHRWRIRLVGGKLWLEPPTPVDPFDHPLEVGTSVDLPIPGWRVRMGSTTAPPPEVRWSWFSRSGARLRVRNIDANDRVESEGEVVRAARMVARRLPRHLRPVWPVFCEDDRIYWIPGVWQDPAIDNREGHVVEVMRCEQSAGGL